MQNSKKTLLILAILATCAIALSFAASAHSKRKVYEVYPQVAYPYGYTNITDNSKLIDIIAKLSYQNQSATAEDLNKKLDSINKKLNEILNRVARIEKALNIKKQKEAPEPLERKGSSQ